MNRNNSFLSYLKDLKGLTCEICFEVYNNENKQPLSLPCGHTFCSLCLRSFQNKCPTCRTSFQESKIQKNYALLSLLNELGREEERCLVHKREVDRFCKSCLKLMCSVCHCQHLGSENIISDMNLRDEIKEIQKSVMETQIQEIALREKINLGFQTKVKKIENEEVQSRQEVQSSFKLETSLIHFQETQLVWQAEEDAKQKIKLIEEQKQKAIEEIKEGTRVKIEAIEAMQKVSLESILSKKMNELSPIKAQNSQILQKMQAFKDFKQAKCDTLTECVNLYQLWEQKRPEMTELLMLNNDSAESLFDKLQDSSQEKERVERHGEDNSLSQGNQENGFERYIRLVKAIEGQNWPEKKSQSDNDKKASFEESVEFQVGEDFDFYEKDGKWVNAQIIDKDENKMRVTYVNKEITQFSVAYVGSARVLKRCRVIFCFSEFMIAGKKGRDFQINNLIEVIDTVHKWCVARVLSVSEDKIFIHYEGWSKKYDEWLLKDSGRK